MNRRYINERGILFELLYIKQDESEARSVVCKRVLDKKVFSFCESQFVESFQAA